MSDERVCLGKINARYPQQVGLLARGAGPSRVSQSEPEPLAACEAEPTHPEILLARFQLCQFFLLLFDGCWVVAVLADLILLLSCLLHKLVVHFAEDGDGVEGKVVVLRKFAVVVRV